MAVERMSREQVCDQILANIQASHDGATRHRLDTLVKSWMGHVRRSARTLELLEHHLRAAGISTTPSLLDARPNEDVEFRVSGGTPKESTSGVTVDNPNAGVVEVSRGLCPDELRPYQDKALKKLQLDGKSRKFAGLLVLPTGAGKTPVAVRWLLGDVVNHGSKVLWVAHRHELLNQAAETFKRLAFQETRNYSAEGRHDRGAAENRGEGIEDGDALLAQGGDVGSDSAEVLSALNRSEAT